MATHRLSLEFSVEKEKVGNSMSTIYSFVLATRKLKVFWKYEEPQLFDVPREVGFVQVNCGGGRPSVVLMYPPKNPIAKVAWEHGFYGKKRVNARQEAENARLDSACSYHDRPRGCEVNKPLIIQGEHYYFVYSVHMEGQIWSPYKWWADEKANPLEMQIHFWDANCNFPAPFKTWLDAVQGIKEDGGYYGSNPEKHINCTFFSYQSDEWRVPATWINAKIALELLQKGGEFPQQSLLNDISCEDKKVFFRYFIKKYGVGRTFQKTVQGIMVSKNGQPELEITV